MRFADDEVLAEVERTCVTYHGTELFGEIVLEVEQ